MAIRDKLYGGAEKALRSTRKTLEQRQFKKELKRSKKRERREPVKREFGKLKDTIGAERSSRGFAAGAKKITRGAARGAKEGARQLDRATQNLEPADDPFGGGDDDMGVGGLDDDMLVGGGDDDDRLF